MNYSSNIIHEKPLGSRCGYHHQIEPELQRRCGQLNQFLCLGAQTLHEHLVSHRHKGKQDAQGRQAAFLVQSYTAGEEKQMHCWAR